MQNNYTPTARPTVPLLAVQRIGDGLTSPSLQRGYDEAVPRSRRNNFQSLWIEGAGHCNISTEATLAAVSVLEQRLDQGRWPSTAALFIEHQPPPMLRVCVKGGSCAGKP
jgi:hypothetical protein